MIRRIKPLRDPIPSDGQPWVADVRSYDIPETIEAMIRNAAPGMVAVSLRPYGGARMIQTAERAARQRNARVIWLPIGRCLREAA